MSLGDTFRANLAYHILRVRREGMLVKQIEFKSGYNRRYIQRIISGEQSNPTLLFVESMAIALGVPVNDMFAK